MVAIYLMGHTIDVEVVITRAIDLGSLMNHLQKIEDLAVHFERTRTSDESLTKDLGLRCAF
jgi:hypothetical protein